MSRTICHQCRRLKVNCLCHALIKIENSVEIFILQHPLEVSQVKGTAKLTQLCLAKSQLQIGEQFSSLELQTWLQDGKTNLLLYPKTGDFTGSLIEAASLASRKHGDYSLSSLRVIVLDGTWKKTRKMMYFNSYLSTLPRVQLAPKSTSKYIIRKQKNSLNLSTLEAIQQLLSDLEQAPEKYAPLLDVMQALIQQQLVYRQPNHLATLD